MSLALNPDLLRVLLISLTLFILEAKIKTCSTCFSFFFCKSNSLISFTFCLSYARYADCLIPSAGFEIAMLISFGWNKMLLANFLIAFGIVAEKSKVCLFFGNLFTILIMSS